jgi:hypothetical protein
LTWTHVSDFKTFDNEVVRLYDIRGIPYNILISPDGKILAKNLKEGELSEKLKELLGD